MNLQGEDSKSRKHLLYTIWLDFLPLAIAMKGFGPQLCYSLHFKTVPDKSPVLLWQGVNRGDGRLDRHI